MAFHHMYFMVCITYLYALFFTTVHTEAASTDTNEIETLRIILQKLGKRDWNFTGDPCLNFQEFRCDYCDKNNNVCHVTNITLPGLNLNGVLPPELANLSHLVGLDISDNYLIGSIPKEFGSMRALRNLTLSENLLFGPIPEELGNLASLVELSLYSNNLNGTLPQEIGNLAALRNMYLSSNQFVGEIPPTLVKLQNLTEFFASSNGFTGEIPNFIGKLIKLEKLILQGTSLKGPIPSSINNLIKMKYLRISDIAEGGSNLDFIKSLINLREIVLRNSNITAKIPDISELTKLEALDLSFNNLYGDIPDSLNSIPSLRFLLLGNNNLSGPVNPWLFSNNAIIDLSYNNLTGDIPSGFISENSRVNLIGNLLNSKSPNDHSWITCLQRNSICNKQPSNYHLAINCGGQELKSSVHGLPFDSDFEELGDSTFYLSPEKNWGVSNIGYFMEHYTEYKPEFETPHIVKGNSPPNSIDPQLYNSARTSPSSLRYYGLDLQNGLYNVTLHFAEIQFPATQNSNRVRIFDVYIQGKNMLKDFNLKEEIVEKNLLVVKNFTINVTNNILEIHFFWAGKGTCCESQEEIYGPLISAIIVDPEFKYYIPKNSKTIKMAIIIGVLVSLGLFLCISLIFIKKTKTWDNIFYFARRDKAKSKKTTGNHFNLMLMKIATKNFDPKNKIGEGGFGAVYKGILPGGRKVAIKQFSHSSKQGNREFLTEVSIISAVQHPNLVKLYGCCVEGGELLLVYEYMENGNLAQALFDPFEARVKLDWPTRYRICLGIARGIAYLHEESLVKIVHRDIKSTNILLDKHLNPKVADFGLARLVDEESTHVSTRVAGTIGYLAPEYALKGHLSDKSDVYSFGVVVLEVVSGRTHTDMSLEEEKNYLLEWAWQLYEEEKTLKLVDVNLLQSGYNEEEVVRMIHVGLLCTHENPCARPCMSAILEMMEGRAPTPAPRSQPVHLNQCQNWELDTGGHHDQAQSSATSQSSDSNYKGSWKDIP
ncbi:probable LRR receptor-like serine/threonine-protein kinase At1g53420 [Cryptomeria japonica]|uniref:probable LRR receptor-like serine/threonine-protein kinase At1g53420 n=1 Tax=Cryptomeria japonica TaxID=3369 RepID=UPI0025AC03CA|nr:probable LRR receptor-like serine/threonine-protein kinase At1g53420 [Cryptomeria japonica]